MTGEQDETWLLTVTSDTLIEVACHRDYDTKEMQDKLHLWVESWRDVVSMELTADDALQLAGMLIKARAKMISERREHE